MADLQLNDIIKQMIAFVDCDERYTERLRQTIYTNFTNTDTMQEDDSEALKTSHAEDNTTSC